MLLRSARCLAARVTAAPLLGAALLAAAAPEPGTAGPRPAAPAAPEKEKPKPKVRAKAFLATDKLPAGGTTEVAVVLQVAGGWHINTNPPKPEFVVPTEVTVKTERGTVVGTFDYPAGEPLAMPGFDEKVSVYEGLVVIRAPVTVPATVAGGDETLSVTVRYQPCNDANCLRPEKVELSGKLPVAAPGESVREINDRWFRGEDERRAERESR